MILASTHLVRVVVYHCCLVYYTMGQCREERSHVIPNFTIPFLTFAMNLYALFVQLVLLASVHDVLQKGY